jgi:hypothetical protein
MARQRMHVLRYGNTNTSPNMLSSGERDRQLEWDERDNPRGSKHARISGYDYDNVNVHENRKPQPDDVDRQAVKKAFLMFVKMIYEDANLKKRYLDTRRNEPPLQCIACVRFVVSYYKSSFIIPYFSPDLVNSWVIQCTHWFREVPRLDMAL